MQQVLFSRNRRLQAIFWLATLVMLSTAGSVWGAPSAHGIFQDGLTLEQSLHIYPARQAFLAAIAADPANLGYQEHYAWFLHNHGFSEEATQVFQRLIPQKSKNAALFKGLGWNLRQVGRLQAALDAYAQTYDLTADRDDPSRALEEISANLSRENAAKINQLKQAMAQQPTDVTLRKQLFRTYVSQGEFGNAISLGKEYFPELKDDLLWRLDFARLLFWNGQKTAAATEYQSLLGVSADSAFLWFELGRVEHASGQLEKAKDSLQRALMINPAEPRCTRELVEVLTRLGQAQAAEAMASALQESPRDTLNPRLALARAYHFSGRLGDAIPKYQRILRDFPNNAEALWGLSESLVYSGDYVEANRVLSAWQTSEADSRQLTQKKLLAAYTSPRLKVLADYYQNSEDFSRWNLGSSYGFFFDLRTRLTLGYHYSRFRQSHFEKINRHALDLVGQRRLSEKFNLGGRLAGNFYDNHQDRINLRLTLEFQPAKDLLLALSAQRLDIIDTELPFNNPIFNPVVTIGAVGRKLYTDDYSLYAKLSPTSRIDLSGKILYGDYSDDNRKLSYFLDLNYRPFYTPKLQVGYNYYFLDFADPASTYREGAESVSAYYDPINFEVHSLYLKVTHDLNPGVQIGVEERLSYLPKSAGFSYSLFAFAKYRIDASNALRLDGRVFFQSEGIDRAGESGFFRAENVMLSFEHRF